MRFTFENIVGRRFLLVLMTALLALGMVACGDDDGKDSNNDKTDVGQVQEDAGQDTGVKTDAADEVDAADEQDTEDETDAADVPEELEVLGSWSSQYGDEEITATQWGYSPLVKFDNAERVAYTRSADDAEYNPGKYGKIVWTPLVDDSFYYCTVEYALDTLEEAENSTTAFDATNPDESGCGGFSWTKLTRK